MGAPARTGPITRPNGGVDHKLTSAHWYKSTRSQSNGQRVEVANLHHAVAARDSKLSAGPALLFTPGAWATFRADVKNGRFNPLR